MRKLALPFLVITLIILLLIISLTTQHKNMSASSEPISIDEMTNDQKQIVDWLIKTEWAMGRLPLEERYQKLSNFYIDDPRYPLSKENRRFVEKMEPFLPNPLPPSDSWGQLTFQKAWLIRGIKGQELFEKMEKGQISASELKQLQQQGLEPLQTLPPYHNLSEVSQLFKFYNFENRDDGSFCIEHALGITKARTCLVEKGGHWYIAFREMHSWNGLPFEHK